MEMHICDFPVPILCIDNFFDLYQSNDILKECIELKDVFVPAKIFNKSGVINSDLNFRKNEVVYLDDVFKNRISESYILKYFDKIRKESRYRKIWNFFSCFELINVADRFEIVVSRYGSGNFYHKHIDVNPKHLNHRLTTIVYYINREPQKFSGGSISFYSDGITIKLPSQHNRAVVFPSNLEHEVEEVDMQEGTWEDGRFSINFWLGFVERVK